MEKWARKIRKISKSINNNVANKYMTEKKKLKLFYFELF